MEEKKCEQRASSSAEGRWRRQHMTEQAETSGLWPLFHNKNQQILQQFLRYDISIKYRHLTFKQGCTKHIGQI